MLAIAVIPGQANSIHLAELPKPSVHEVPNGRGVLVLESVTGGAREHSLPADKINLDFVLGNKLVIGTVNANREYFEAGVYDFARAELEFPGWLPKLLTRPVTGLENYQEVVQKLTTERGAITVFVNVSYD